MCSFYLFGKFVQNTESFDNHQVMTSVQNMQQIATGTVEICFIDYAAVIWSPRTTVAFITLSGSNCKEGGPVELSSMEPWSL